jgi:ribose 5-phosphate isomerase A
MYQEQKRAAAAMALSEVRDGMRLGLGTGSTAREFVALLGERVAAGLDCLCVPTSEVTAAQARALNIPLTDLDTIDRLDLTIDGADEVDPNLDLIKGAGGALLREKIVAAASDRMVVIADISKDVPVLGRFLLPIEVNRFGLGATRRALAEILVTFGAEGGMNQRLDAAGNSFVTDGGHVILDALFGRISAAEALSRALLDVPGVVQHGLFLGMCQTVYLAGPNGVTRRDRGGAKA